jgi:hypothetical protein
MYATVAAVEEGILPGSAVRRCVEAGLVGGNGFATDASLIKADANKQCSVEGSQAVDWKGMAAPRHSVWEYIDTLDEAAWGAARRHPAAARCHGAAAAAVRPAGPRLRRHLPGRRSDGPTAAAGRCMHCCGLACTAAVLIDLRAFTFPRM